MSIVIQTKQTFRCFVLTLIIRTSHIHISQEQSVVKRLLSICLLPLFYSPKARTISYSILRLKLALTVLHRAA